LENTLESNIVEVKSKRYNLSSAEGCFNFALEVIGGRYPQGEDIIGADPIYAFRYATQIIRRGPFIQGEDAISTNANDSLEYARCVLHARFIKGEETIRQNANVACFYAAEVLERRWLEAEPVILQDLDQIINYCVFTIDGAWPEAEHIIAESPQHSFDYATQVLRGRFIKGEKTIINSPYLERYKNFLKGMYKEFIEDNKL
jgi:hypothetical protein